MGCAQSAQNVSTPQFHQFRQHKYKEIPPAQTDASRVKREDIINQNMKQLTNMVKMMASKIQKQDQLIERMSKQKQQTKQIKKSSLQEYYEKLQNIGQNNIKNYQVMCKDCKHKRQVFTQLRKGLKLCQCYGYGNLFINDSNVNSKCSVCNSYYGRAMIICEECYGKGAVIS